MISLDGISLTELKQPLLRNIVSLRKSQDLFDDLSDDTTAWEVATQLEMTTKPWPYVSSRPLISRPFEEAEFLNAILYPFEPSHWSASRFSRGHFGVWYGSDTLKTSIYETVYHWKQGLLADAGWATLANITMERRIHQVTCNTHLIDMTRGAEQWPELVANDYSFCQQLGEQVHHEGHPGLWTRSARCAGTNAVLFTPTALTAPTTLCYLTYKTTKTGVAIYRERHNMPLLSIASGP